MTYKETLFFVGKCLTISHEEHHKILVEQELKSGKIDWDNVVKLSTAHYVFPALYCNLKRANFLHYLPTDLVEYMKHITDLNRERNQQIINQAKEINDLLSSNNITPIFLKGTGNLLEGLYEDIAERMVGDIDFIFSRKDYPKAINLLSGFGYSKVHKTNYHFPSFKHYPRIQKEGNIAAVEIHKELLTEQYADEFNFKLVSKDSQFINGMNVMSFQNQLCLSIIAKQINDKGFQFNNIALRNAYDVYLLSKKTEAKKAIQRFNQLFNPLNCFLAICHSIFGEVNSLKYNETKEADNYISLFENIINNKSFRKKHHSKTTKKVFIKSRLQIIYKSFFDKNYKEWLLNRLTDKNWMKVKLTQLGLKKPKSNS